MKSKGIVLQMCLNEKKGENVIFCIFFIKGV